MLSPSELEDWQRLVVLFPSLSEGRDEVSWTLSRSGMFSVKSLYSELVAERRTSRFSPVWKDRIPPKIKVFLWQAFKLKLPSSDQIHKRNPARSANCVVCGTLEDALHIFFHCPLAKFMWSCFREWLGNSWDPRTFGEVRSLVLPLSSRFRRLFWTVFAAACWVLWNIRNKFTIEHIFPKYPAIFIFKLIGFLQIWKPLCKSADLEDLESIISRMKATAIACLPQWQ